MPYKPFKQKSEYCVFKIDANGNKIGSSLGCHPSEQEAYKQIAAIEASEEMNKDDRARSLFEEFWQSLKYVFVHRRIKNVESWDGAASNYSSTEKYCNACLINLNDGDPADWVQAQCKLPVREEGDSKDTFVRQAVYAAAQRFNQVDAPQEALNKARNELITAYNEMGEEPPESIARAIALDSIIEQTLDAILLQYPEAFFHSVFMDNDGNLFAVISQSGKLYKSMIKKSEMGKFILEEPNLVEQEFVPIQSRTKIMRQSDGRYRWLSISATSVLNRVGEIDSMELFDNFTKHIEETGQYPIRQFYHLGDKFRTGQYDYIVRYDYCLITSGLYDENNLLAEIERKAIEKDGNYWGESICYKPLGLELLRSNDDVYIPAYTDGILKEISTLPEAHAANLFTIITEVKRKMFLTSKAREAFVKLFSDAGLDEEEANKWLEENADETNRSIEQSELITRGDEPREEGDLADDAASEPVNEAQPKTEIELTDEALNEIVSRTVAVLEEKVEKMVDKVSVLETISKLNEALSTVGDRLAKLEQTEDIKKQEWQEDMPRNQKLSVTYRPRDAHKKDGEEKLLTAAEKAELIRQNGSY